MCACNPLKRTPVCIFCPDDYRAKFPMEMGGTASKFTKPSPFKGGWKAFEEPPGNDAFGGTP